MTHWDLVEDFLMLSQLFLNILLSVISESIFRSLSYVNSVEIERNVNRKKSSRQKSIA